MHILHLSDIHAQINNYQTRRMRNKIKEKISELSRHKAYNYVILSGDITHQGQEFSETHITFLHDILDAANLPINNLILLPGNHDLIRNTNRTKLIDEIYNGNSPSDNLDEILDQENHKRTIFSSFGNFSQFFLDFKKETYLIDDVHTLLELEKCYLISMNTCLIADKAGEEGKLLIGKSKLLDCLEKLPSKKSKPIIAVGHHTLDCLESQDKRAVLSLFDDYKVDLYLSGHVHSASYNYEANNYNSLLTIVCSGVHFDGYTIGGFVDIEITENQFHLTQYHWNSQQEYWTKNNSLGRKMSEGTLIHDFEIAKNKETEEMFNVEILKAQLFDLLNENTRVFKQYGPRSIIANHKPYSELAYVWKKKVNSVILPNNDKSLLLLEESIDSIPLKNRHILTTYKNQWRKTKFIISKYLYSFRI